MSFVPHTISRPFLWRRIHSLLGLWLVLYIIEHLIVNSQATLWLGDDGIGFVRLVNLLEALPYLQVIEIVLIGVPLLVHGVWGIQRIFQAKQNASGSHGTEPSLPYCRNVAFSWQRWTSWILLVAIVAHVVQMRFLDMPKTIRINGQERYTVQVSNDSGLPSLAQRVGVVLEQQGENVLIVAESPGKAMLFMVRDTFKHPLMCILYSIFVLAASFHAFNGLWTALITWGMMLSYRSQKAMLPICWVGVDTMIFLGFAAIWGSYWINLRG